MMRKLYYNTLFTCALALGVAVIMPDFLMAFFSVDSSLLPAWGWWIYAFYVLGAAIALLIYYGRRAAQIKDPTGELGFSFGAALGFSVLCSLGASVVLGGLTWVLNNYVSPQTIFAMIDRNREMVFASIPTMTEPLYVQMTQIVYFSLLWLWFKSLLTMFIICGMAGMISAVYVKRNKVV